MASCFTGFFRVESVFVPPAAAIIKADTDLMDRVVVPLSLAVPACSCVGMLSAANCNNTHSRENLCYIYNQIWKIK